MRDLAVLTFVTLDGVMQAPSSPDEDRTGGFQQGGWAAPYWDGVMAQVKRQAMHTPYDILLGRKTYDLFADYWPHADPNPIADMMNAAKKYVVTSNSEGLDWNNSTAVGGDIPAAIRKLKEDGGPLLQVHGSAQLIQTLSAHDLIDEYRLWTFPVVVGSGKRLFEPKCTAPNLQLERSEPSSNGVMMSFYRFIKDSS